MPTTDPAVQPAGLGDASALTVGRLADLFPPGSRGQWSVPVWALSIDGRGQWCNGLAETWVRDSPDCPMTSTPTRPRRRHRHYPSCLTDVFDRALDRPEELPRRAAISRASRRLQVLVSRLDDASGRQVGILVAGVPSGGNGRS